MRASKSAWYCSYDDCEPIRNLYQKEWADIQELTITGSINGCRTNREVLISRKGSLPAYLKSPGLQMIQIDERIQSRLPQLRPDEQHSWRRSSSKRDAAIRLSYGTTLFSTDITATRYAKGAALHSRRLPKTSPTSTPPCYGSSRARKAGAISPPTSSPTCSASNIV